MNSKGEKNLTSRDVYKNQNHRNFYKVDISNFLPSFSGCLLHVSWGSLNTPSHVQWTSSFFAHIPFSQTWPHWQSKSVLQIDEHWDLPENEIPWKVILSKQLVFVMWLSRRRNVTYVKLRNMILKWSIENANYSPCWSSFSSMLSTLSDKFWIISTNFSTKLSSAKKRNMFEHNFDLI